MSENKFIKKLKGVATTGSVLELENQATPTSFANMPSGTSNPNTVYSDHRGNATAVLKGTQNWKLNGSALDLATQVNGDGTDYTGDIQCSGSGLWVNATYTFPSTGDLTHPVAAIFNAGTKWVLKLCGHGLLSHNKTIDFSLVVKLGTSNIMTKNFTISEQAFEFCQEFIIDYDESIQSLVKAQGGSTLTVQLLCGDASASATIYNGMTVLTCLQRGVDASTVSASFANVEEVMRDGLLPNDYFSNAAFIGQVNDGDKAYAVFQRSGDEMNLAGWDEPIPSQTGNAGKYLTTDGSDMSWHQITASDVGALPDSTKYGASFVLSMNSSTFVITAQLKDQDGNNLGSAQTIDLPLESVVVNGSYDNATKSLILTLENGNTITIPVADLISGLQEELVSGTNIKTINGNSILGAGNLQVSGFLPYEAGWTTNSTTKAFCDDIAADGSAVVGNAYLGEVTINDMPAGIGNGEIKVYILDGTNASNKVIQLELTSGNVAPYKWIYTYWNGGSDVSGWTTGQEPLVSGTNIKTVNSTSLLGSGDITIDGLPTQTGQGGKYLTTDGSTASWATVDALPTQTGNSGKLLTTNGTSASWTEIKTINSGSLVGSGNIDVLVNEATATNALGVGYTTINTTYNDSINIGNASQVLGNNAIALGAFASAEGQDSIAIYSSTGTAHRARTTHTGNIAIGYNALAINAPYTIAIGYNAYAQGTNSIQLGTGNNASANTLQVASYKLLNTSTGLIPTARLADQTSATQGQALILDANLDGQWTTIATVATSGDYDDLLNKPTIPAAQVNSDWNANSGVAEILNKPTLGTAAAADTTDFATAAQGMLADTALQSGDNVSELVNDAGYLVMGDLTGFVTRTTAQTISGLKTFSADIALSGTTSIKNTTSGVSYTMLYRDASGIHVGTSTQALLLAGSGTRPTFNSNNMALLSDVPTAVSQLSNDSGFITNAVNDLQNYTLSSSLATVATSGQYSDLTGTPSLATVATSGDYDDLINKPSIPAAQVNSDWNAISGIAQILNKPTLATVATSGDYDDLINKPTIPAAQVNSDWNANSGVAEILNKPTLGTMAAESASDYTPTANLATVATSGLYSDLSGTPTIPTTLAGLTGDVSISSPSNGEHLVYNGTSQKWENTASAATVSWGGITGTLSNQTDLDNALANKVSTGHEVIAFQAPTAGNNYTWYRKYADGWVEQGGIYTITASSFTNFNLIVPMADTHYFASGNCTDSTTNVYTLCFNPSSFTTTTFSAKTGNAGSGNFTWEVKGIAAS